MTNCSPGNVREFAPELFKFTSSVLNMFEVDNRPVARHFKRHCMASTTFNFGPVVCTFPHKDLKNLSWGWCSVTSLGNYDHRLGGHLVLWDLEMVIEFPPHSTILLPSAILMHSNTAIQEGEERQTVTQYSSAGLFAWHAYGNKKASEGTPAYWWKHPRHMFSKLGELVK